MPGQQDLDEGAEPAPEVATEIGSSLASVWARYFGARPSKAETEFKGDVVRWTLVDGTSVFEAGMSAATAEDESRTVRTVASYERDTIAAVAKATHRRVMAMISDRDAKTGIVTEKFILERPVRRY